MIQQNRYNGDGQRIQKVEGSKTTNYYYQDGVVSYTTDGDNIQTSQNLIGTDGNILATQRYGSDHTDYLLYHKDIQGSTTSLVKEDESADATTGIQTLERQRLMAITKQRMRFVILEESMIRVQDCII